MSIPVLTFLDHGAFLSIFSFLLMLLEGALPFFHVALATRRFLSSWGQISSFDVAFCRLLFSTNHADYSFARPFVKEKVSLCATIS